MLRDSKLVGLDNACMVTLSSCSGVSIWYLIKGACHVTVMTVGDSGVYSPTPYILLGQLPRCTHGSATYAAVPVSLFCDNKGQSRTFSREKSYPINVQLLAFVRLLLL